MALLQYFRSVLREQQPLPGQSLVLAKGLIFRGTTFARKFNPRIITVTAKFMLVVYCRMRAYTHTLDEPKIISENVQ